MNQDFFNSPYVIGILSTILAALIIGFIGLINSKIFKSGVSIAFDIDDTIETDYQIRKNKSNFLNKSFFERNTSIFDTTNPISIYEGAENKYPHIILLNKSKDQISAFVKYYRVKVINFKVNPEQVINIIPIAPTISFNSELNFFSSDLSLDIEHCGFDIIKNLEISINDNQVQNYFHTNPILIDILEPNKKKVVKVLNINQLKNNTLDTLSFNVINLNIKYEVQNTTVKKAYVLTYPLYKYEKRCEIRFNINNGFYLIRPDGGLGAGAVLQDVKSIKIKKNDFMNQKTKLYDIEINRKLSKDGNSDSIERLHFQIIPDTPSNFSIEIFLMDENKKRISNKLFRNYKTFFSKE